MFHPGYPMVKRNELRKRWSTVRYSSHARYWHSSHFVTVPRKFQPGTLNKHWNAASHGMCIEYPFRSLVQNGISCKRQTQEALTRLGNCWCFTKVVSDACIWKHLKIASWKKHCNNHCCPLRENIKGFPSSVSACALSARALRACATTRRERNICKS